MGIYKYKTLYPRKLFVAVGGKFKDIHKRFWSYKGTELDYQDPNNFLALTIKVMEKGTNHLGELIWLPNNNPEVSVMAHEAFHAMSDICEDLNIGIDTQNQEPCAYFMGWICEKIQESLLKEQKDGQRNSTETGNRADNN